MKQTKPLMSGLLICIVLLGFLFRLVRVADIPPGLNRDEAAIGYTAYSLLKTGKDEYGKSWPLSLKSFGDWKLPGYVYITIPSVALFGLSEFAVRFPSVLAGTLTILLSYLIVKELFKNKTLALVSALLLAISPWHIFFSRVTSEANMAVFETTLAFWFLLEARQKHWLIPVSFVILALTLLTYHGNHVFTPLLFLLFLWFFKDLWKYKKGKIGLGLFAIMTLGIFSITLFSADKTKISGLFSLNDESLIHEQIVKNRLIYTNPILARLFNNKLIFIVEQIAQNYVKSFSPEFLFIRGGGNKQHNIADFGNLYLVEAPFILIVLYLLFARREKSALLLLGWILFSAVGPALTKDAPHSARQFAIFPALTWVTAYGLTSLIQLVKNNQLRKLVGSVIVLLFIINASVFFARYFVLFPYKAYADWGAGYKEMITKVKANKNNYEEIFINRPDYSPYIYYLFYQKSDPTLVQTTLEHYPETSEGFSHVKRFDGITYTKLAWANELLIPNRLYVDWAESVPNGATNSATFISKTELTKLKADGEDTSEIRLGDYVTSRIVDKVLLPDQTPFLYLIETRIGTPSATSL